jgi:ribosomal subunit interface protein
MDLLLKGRGTRITDHMRSSAEKKLARLERMEPRATRIEIEVTFEKNPRMGGVKRVEAALDTPRKTFRAIAQGSDVDSAFDQLAEKLERQLRDHRAKKRTRVVAGAKRLKSAQVASEAVPEEGSEA